MYLRIFAYPFYFKFHHIKTIKRFYRIREISIGGRCVCNGHAQLCEAFNSTRPNKLLCRCAHNTTGDQCERCLDSHVQKKWRPGRANHEFECERKTLPLHLIRLHLFN